MSARGLVDRKLLFWVNIEFITFQVWLLVMTNASHIYAYSAIKLWNQLKPELKKSNTLKAFKDNVFKYYYKDQSCLAHFNP